MLAAGRQHALIECRRFCPPGPTLFKLPEQEVDKVGGSLLLEEKVLLQAIGHDGCAAHEYEARDRSGLSLMLADALQQWQQIR